MAWKNKEEKQKEALIKEGKDLGLNLSKDMSLYELEHRVQEAKDSNKSEPAKQSSSLKGEY